MRNQKRERDEREGWRENERAEGESMVGVRGLRDRRARARARLGLLVLPVARLVALGRDERSGGRRVEHAAREHAALANDSTDLEVEIGGEITPDLVDGKGSVLRQAIRSLDEERVKVILRLVEHDDDVGRVEGGGDAVQVLLHALVRGAIRPPLAPRDHLERVKEGSEAHGERVASDLGHVGQHPVRPGAVSAEQRAPRVILEERRRAHRVRRAYGLGS